MKTQWYVSNDWTHNGRWQAPLSKHLFEVGTQEPNLSKMTILSLQLGQSASPTVDQNVKSEMHLPFVKNFFSQVT